MSERKGQGNHVSERTMIVGNLAKVYFPLLLSLSVCLVASFPSKYMYD